MFTLWFGSILQRVLSLITKHHLSMVHASLPHVILKDTTLLIPLYVDYSISYNDVMMINTKGYIPCMVFCCVYLLYIQTK